MRRSFIVGWLVLLSILLAPASTLAADRVVHTTTTFTDTFSQPLDPGGECFGGGETGTVSGSVEVTMKRTEVVAGPKTGQYHLVATGQGQATIDAGGQTYTATFTTHFTESGTGDVPRVFAFHNHPQPFTSADGTTVKLAFHIHTVMDQNGKTRVDFVKVNCIK